MASSSPYRAPGFPPRAAYSHSASVGRRMSTCWQYLSASVQLTLSTGSLSSPLNLLGLVPVTFINAPWVTGVWPIQKPFVMVTERADLSLGSHSESFCEQPITNVPGGINT